MEDSVLAPSSFLKGRIDVPAEEPVPFDFPVITTDVEAYFQFWQSDDYLRLYDVISLQFGRNAEDLLTGTLETMDLKLTGIWQFPMWKMSMSLSRFSRQDLLERWGSDQERAFP